MDFFDNGAIFISKKNLPIFPLENTPPRIPAKLSRSQRPHLAQTLKRVERTGRFTDELGVDPLLCEYTHDQLGENTLVCKYKRDRLGVDTLLCEYTFDKLGVDTRICAYTQHNRLWGGLTYSWVHT